MVCLKKKISKKIFFFLKVECKGLQDYNVVVIKKGGISHG